MVWVALLQFPKIARVMLDIGDTCVLGGMLERIQSRRPKQVLDAKLVCAKIAGARRPGPSLRVSSCLIVNSDLARL